MKNKNYKQLIYDLFVWLLKSDQVDNDLTTNNLFQKSKAVTSQIITRHKTTIAGLEEIEYLIKTFTKLTTKLLCKDGATLEPNQIIMQVSGDVRELLAYERVILNILQRLSGIASETKNIVTKIEGLQTFVAATRKTVWGVLDKKAVALGGGLTHRLNLSDGILVKDNHVMLLPTEDVLQKLLQAVNKTLIEIEVEDETNFKQLIKTFEQTKTDNVLAILLDNFSSKEAKKLLSQTKTHPNILYEASGGITSDNIVDWAQTGVDVISLGSLTHSPKSANLSLEIIT